MKAKKLIEVAMPIKEISAESVRDKSIRHGHISTLHLWWARRPLPACRAIVFGSLVPDPDDEACPQAFKDAVAFLLGPQESGIVMTDPYKPYKDIPYTAIIDPMDDTLRNRLMMFIGKFSDKCQENMIAGRSTSPKEQLSDGSLIKWENKNNPKILGKARELIFVAYNSGLDSNISFESLHREFGKLTTAITDAEDALYSTVNRHQHTAETERLEQHLHDAIEAFQKRMPSVFDPFAGGGAIPLEAARLGCRSYGNDINPVAHIIERGSAEFPQKYGKPITYTEDEFNQLYGERGRKMLKEKNIHPLHGKIEIPNRLAWDVEYYANIAFNNISEYENLLFPRINGEKPLVYIWAKVAHCTNPSCHAEIPLLGQFYISKRRGAPKSSWKYLNPLINDTNISFTIENGESHENSWIGRANLTCPCCGSVTNASVLKKEFKEYKDTRKLLCVITEKNGKRSYIIPDNEYLSLLPNISGIDVPNEPMPIEYTQAMPSCTWGIERWGQLFSQRQAFFISKLRDTIIELKKQIDLSQDYYKSVIAYLTILVDRVIVRHTEFGVWHVLQETVEHPFGRQAIPMKFTYPEMNPFSDLSGAYYGQLDSILRVIEEEQSFSSVFYNCSSGENEQFNQKSITSVITDPPYYDAIAYADLSDFFYVWQKQILVDVFPFLYATPLTPKKEECTALKHYHNGNYENAKIHFENKLTQIFDAIESQTTDIVSIMFAHQSTEAWTTLCNSILDAKMNITGSWPIDTEVSIALKSDKGFLESSVTVACRPNERKGFEEYKVVEQAIKDKVKEEVEKLYELGFRGADLLTACFGQAVSEFGKYKVVERADGKRVTVAELLELARQTAFDTLLSGIKADELTRFYIGWLQMNGMGETNHDDVTKFTRVGVNVDIHEVIQEGLLVSNGSKNHLATAEEHIGGVVMGTRPSDPLIDQVHRAMLFVRKQDNDALLKLIRECAPTSDKQFWRVLASLKELLPAGKDLTDVQELLRTGDYLRTKCKEEIKHEQASLFD